jgi:Putative transposase/Transposase zinc-binding domain
MSHALAAIQEQAETAADAFCRRSEIPPSRKRRRTTWHSQPCSPTERPRPRTGKFYRPRDHAASPFFKIVRDHFDEFERVYPERYQDRYGFWRPVIRSSIDKFLKCGDLKEGFARVRCPDCKEEFFVAFSCRQRSCCPSCDQKRSLLLAYRLNGEVLAEVPHRQWVFTIPKRLRVYFRYDRKLLGKLCRAAYDTVCDVFKLEIDGDSGVPAMIGAVQTFGDLVHWHSHIHAIVPEGVFTESGHFVHIPDIWKHRAAEFWQERVFCLLLDVCKINAEVVGNMRTWKHSGFSVDNSVRINAGDTAGMQRLIEYIARCPFSLGRMVSLTKDGKILYRAAHPNCLPFPLSGDTSLLAGIPRNFEVFDPLDFLAEVTQHIPNKGEHQIRYYGFYSNKSRGRREKDNTPIAEPGQTEPDTPFRRKCRITWAALIKAVYEVDPLKCPKCGGTMRIISFIEEAKVIEKILRHCELWKEPAPHPPPVKILGPPKVECGPALDYQFFDQNCV